MAGINGLLEGIAKGMKLRSDQEKEDRKLEILEGQLTTKAQRDALDDQFKQRQLDLLTDQRDTQNELNREKLEVSKEFRTTARADRAAAMQEKKDLKAALAAKLTDKQVEAFTDLDNAASDLNNLLDKLGQNSDWTGSLDARIPDMLVGDDQVAWRSAVGKYKDAYRKAITGAGASTGEIKILESRLPTATDTFANFVSKSKEALSEINRRKGVYATNLSKSGKDVSQYFDLEGSGGGGGGGGAGGNSLVLPPVDAFAKERARRGLK